MERVGVELQALGRRTFTREMSLATGSVRGVGDAARNVRGPLGLFNRDLDDTRKRSHLAKTAVRGLALGIGGIAVGVGAAGIAAFKQIGQGFEGLAAQEAAAAQVRAGIKSTGNAANVSAKQLGRFADQMERRTGIEYEAVQAAQATLLTFTNVRNGQTKSNKVFDRAIKLSADLSTRFGGDLKKSALQVGKALNDPIKGITALSRVGVSFTDQQKEQIKTLVEHGETMKAQRIILRELATEVGGSAKAQGNTWDGLKKRVGNAWGNIQESFAGAIQPLIKEWLPKLQDKFNEWADWIHDHRGDIRRFVKDGFERLKTAAQAVSDWWDTNGENVKSGLRRIGEIAQKFAPYMDDMVKAYLGWKTVTKATSGLKAAADAMSVLKLAMVGAGGSGGLVAAIGTLGPILAGFTGVVAAFGQAWKHARLADGDVPGRNMADQVDHVGNLITNPGGGGDSAPGEGSIYPKPHAASNNLKSLSFERVSARSGPPMVLNFHGVDRTTADRITQHVDKTVAKHVRRR